MAEREQRAVLVLPDLGVEEARIQKLQGQFQNAIAGTLERAELLRAVIVVVVVVVVFAPRERG